MPDLSNKYLRVTFNGGETYDVPLMVVARDRADWEADDHGGSAERALAEYVVPLFLANPGEAIEWAACDMNWSDLAPHAVRVAPAVPDYEDEWPDSLKRIVDRREMDR